MWPGFSSTRFSLIDRNIIWATAHIRGGKMERLTCYNHDTTWKKIEIIYGKEDL